MDRPGAATGAAGNFRCRWQTVCGILRICRTSRATPSQFRRASRSDLFYRRRVHSFLGGPERRSESERFTEPKRAARPERFAGPEGLPEPERVRR